VTEYSAEKIRYVHTNLVARDWRKLAQFYQTVFGCVPIPPERDLRGMPLDEATGISDAHIRGLHLRLPGHGIDGPTLEIFQYDRELDGVDPAANRPGFAHIAFAVDDVHTVRDEVIAAGGGELGKLVTHEVEGVGWITFAYLKDPEGNLIEVQSVRPRNEGT
jgi:predicted enzyme related to lactoylglutathione lyase